ncbi:MAG: Maf family protein [Desulfosudaceae bacterium]
MSSFTGRDLSGSDLSGEGSLILASASPRRKYLLEQAGLSFSVRVSRVDESVMPWSDPVAYTGRLAAAKAAEIAEQYPDSWVIGADTIVVAEGVVLEKPSSRDAARQMLSRLSGLVHEVYTGYAIVCHARQHEYVETIRTEVRFKNLSSREIEWYIHTSEPYDKAGAYAIQGLGSFLVREIRGSYTNVVGLPVCEVLDYLWRLGLVNREVPAAATVDREVCS